MKFSLKLWFPQFSLLSLWYFVPRLNFHFASLIFRSPPQFSFFPLICLSPPNPKSPLISYPSKLTIFLSNFRHNNFVPPRPLTLSRSPAQPFPLRSPISRSRHPTYSLPNFIFFSSLTVQTYDLNFFFSSPIGGSVPRLGQHDLLHPRQNYDLKFDRRVGTKAWSARPSPPSSKLRSESTYGKSA